MLASFLRFNICFAPPGEGGAGDPPNDPPDDDLVDVADKPREPTPYEIKLRRESAKYRTAAKAKEEELARVKSEGEANLAAVKAQAKTEADQRVIRAELKASALKAGMVDLDGLKLLDLSKVTLNDKGEIEGADSLMEEAKKSKPYLFGEATNTSSNQKTPDPKPGEKKTAKDYAPGSPEYLAAKAEITGVRASR
jgi:hypothetical protein